ncbi:MAG: hypothetical protein H6710_05505 [Myxococcales bacterium]|nr:hypothetical protein [Myxococcales bacterium]MCB9704391.1 hypothetical protein [Myxococcales bacterium]
MRASKLLRPALAILWLSACGDVPRDTADEQASTPSADPAAAAKPGEPSAEELLADAVVALGGADKISAIGSYYIESKMDVQGLGLTGVAHTWWQDGDFYSETEMPGVGLMRLGGKAGKVWSDDPINGFRFISGIEAEQAAWSTSRCLALDWKRYFNAVEVTEIAEKEGKRLAELTFTSPSADKVVLRLDMETKMPVSQSFKQANPLGAMPVTVTFDDFREVAGTKVAFKQFVDASLTKMTSVTDKFEANVEIPADRFAIPMVKAQEIAAPANAPSAGEGGKEAAAAP